MTTPRPWWDGIWDAFAFVLFTLAAVTVVTLATAVLGIRFTGGVARLAGAASLALGWGLRLWMRRLCDARDWSFAPVQGSRGLRARDLLLAVPLLAAAGIYLAMWFSALVAPERSWDGNTYHLPAIHAWLHAGQIHWIDSRMANADIMNGYPKNAELLGMAAVQLSGSRRLSHCQNLLFLPLGFLAVACLVRLAGVGRRGALLGGALFLLAPVNLAQSVTTYVDTAYACCVVAFLAALGLAVRQLRATGNLPWHCLPMMGSAFGLGVGIRQTAVFLLPGALVALGMLTPRAEAGGGSRRALRYGGAALFVAAAALWGLAIGGFWYARNVRRDGNPFYPVRITVLGKTLFAGRDLKDLGIEGQADEAMQGWSRPRQILYAWAQGLTEWPASIRRVDSRTGGLGFLWVLGCVPAIFMVGRRAARDEEFAPLLAVAGVALVAFLATPENWWARYTVWIYAAGLPCFARVARDAFAAGRKGIVRAWAMACVGVVLLEGALGAAEVVSRSYPGPRPLRLADALTRSNWRWPSNYLYPATRGSLFDQALAGSDAVAFGPTLADGKCRVRKGMVGQLAQPVGRRAILPIPLGAGHGDLTDLLRGARYLIWDTGAIPPHCAPPEELLRLGSAWSQVDGFWIARMSGKEPSP